MNNYFDVLKRVCILAHEEIPVSFSIASAPYPEIKQYIRNIVEEICTKFPWTFKERKYTFVTEKAVCEYAVPENIVPSNIVKNGIKIEGNLQPLEFIYHDDFDKLPKAEASPLKYSFYGNKLLLYPAPDKAYAVSIKYLTAYYATDGVAEKPNLELETDRCIIADRWLHAVEWGAYALYRLNYKPDQKYTFAKARYDSYIEAMIKQDGYTQDCSPSLRF